MKVIIENNVTNRILEHYQNVMKKYRNTYSIENLINNVNKVESETYKVGAALRKVNPSASYIINKWKSYNVDYSKDTEWYFAYKIEGEIIHVFDAENYNNMSDEARVPQNNRNKQSSP
jgi:hypothetical protein